MTRGLAGLANRGTPLHKASHLLRGFVPMLLEAGATEEQVETMLVQTPRRLLPVG